MSFTEAMYEFLAAQPGITAIVDDRIYPHHLPEGAKIEGAITWFRVSAPRVHTYGTDEVPMAGDWVNARIQFDCWDTTAEKAARLGDQVVIAFSGYGGDMGGQVQAVSTVENEIDTFETPLKVYRRIVEVIVSYQETTETLEGSESS